MLVNFAAPLPVQVPNNVLEKLIEDGMTLGWLPCVWETWKRLLIPSLTSLSFLLFSLCELLYYINKYLKT